MQLDDVSVKSQLDLWQTLNKSDPQKANDILQRIQFTLQDDVQRSKEIALRLCEIGENFYGYCIYSLLKPLFPADVDLHKGIATTLLHLGKPAEAEAALFQLLETFQKTPENLLFAANFHKIQGRLSDAAFYFHLLHNSAPQFVDAYLCCASLHFVNGHFSEAIDCLQKGLEQNPEALDLKANLHMVQLSVELSSNPATAYKRIQLTIGRHSVFNKELQTALNRLETEAKWISDLYSIIHPILPNISSDPSTVDCSLIDLKGVISQTAIAIHSTYRNRLEMALDAHMEIALSAKNSDNCNETAAGNMNIVIKWITDFKNLNPQFFHGQFADAMENLPTFEISVPDSLFYIWMDTFVKNIGYIRFLEQQLISRGQKNILLSNDNKQMKAIANTNFRHRHPVRWVLATTERIIQHYQNTLYSRAVSIPSRAYENAPGTAGIPKIGIIDDMPNISIVKNAKIIRNHLGIYSQSNELIADSMFYQHGPSKMLPGEPLSKTEFDQIPDTQYLVEKEPTLFLGYLTDIRYGHFWADNLSRLWYLGINDWHGKFLFFSTDFVSIQSVDEFPVYAKEIFSLARIPLHRVEIARGNVIYKKMVIPEPGTVIHSHAYKGHTHFFRKIAESALQKPISPKAQEIIKKNKIYIARNAGLKDANRLYFGEEIIQQMMQDNGFSVVHPHTLSEIEKAQILNHVDTIVGVEGSAFYALLYCLRKPDIHIFEEQGDATILSLFPTLLQLEPKLYKNICHWAGTTTSRLPGVGTALRPTRVDIAEALRSCQQAGLIPESYSISYDQQAIDVSFEEKKQHWQRSFQNSIRMAEHNIKMKSAIGFS